MSISRRTLLSSGLGLTVAGTACVNSGRKESTAAAAARSQLQIFFEGLCLLAVQQLSGSLGNVKALLPDVCNLPRTPRAIDMHKPLLCIPKAFLPSGSTDPDCPDPTMWAWPLAGMDVTLKVDGTTPVGPVTGVNLNLPETRIPYGDDWRDLKWLANLKAIQAATSPPKKVARGHVMNAPSANGAVSSRINLTGGTLGGSVPSSWSGRVIKWAFDGCVTVKLPNQMMTDVARYDSPAGQVFEICLTAPGATTCSTTIVLRAPADGSAIPIYIHNMTLKRKCASPMPTVPHFAAYYALLTDVPQELPVLSKGGTIAGYEVQCPVDADNPIYCPPPLAEAEV
jgi:hypothetical protein